MDSLRVYMAALPPPMNVPTVKDDDPTCEVHYTQDMDPVAREVAREHGLDCGEHVARKLMGAHCRDAEIILVMEARQRDVLIKSYPEVSGKVFLLSHWNGGRNIPDPYRRGKDAFEQVYRLLDKAAEAWAGKL